MGFVLRWAAKEAAIKAIRSRRVRFHEVTIESKKGLPYMFIDLPEARAMEENTTAEVAMQQDIGEVGNGAEEEAGRGTFEAKLSISHDGTYATAIVMAIDETSKPYI
jgi:phosphopantetheinyl transferase (holo-ACP synthase)